jgi:hypothetical protein
MKDEKSRGVRGSVVRPPSFFIGSALVLIIVSP